MTQFLFGAEADKIQDTLFRAARQRQVVGGSRLLAEFGERASTLAQSSKYGATADDVLITAGGNFRICFPSREQALAFGEELANAYRLLLDASITIAEPEPIGAKFSEVNEQVGKSIRHRKRAERGAHESPHAPTTAFCQSSGSGLAAVYDRPLPAEDKQYLARFAQWMGQASEDLKEQKTADSFLGKIQQCLPEGYQDWGWENVDWIARRDRARKNVAYLIADGNNMGEMFGVCEADELKRLSTALDDAMRRAVAHAIPPLADKLSVQGTLPILPLILAGDDAFVLLPARYALDFAQQFCLAFEEALGNAPVVQALKQKMPDLPPPTIAAAVVICKGHYPYHLAHRRGEELLKQAKRVVKSVGAHREGSWHSAIAFEMIVGSELVATRETPREFRPSLMVYWATAHRDRSPSAKPLATRALSAEAERNALPIERLLEQRLHVKNLPDKRREEIRGLFAPEALPKDHNDLRTRWQARLKRLRDRLKATLVESKATPGAKDNLTLFDKAMSALGDPSDAHSHWLFLQRSGEKSHYAHGLPDLIEVWDYAQALDHPLSDYEEEA